MTTTLSQLFTLITLVFFLILCAATVAYMLGFQILITAILVFAPVCFKKRWYKWFYIFYKTLPRDIIAASRFIKLNILLKYWEMKKYCIGDIFKLIADKNPDKVAIYFEDTEWTYKQMDELSNKIARYFKRQGLQKGDAVALLMENRPEYACIWLALSKIGVCSALINTNLIKQPLVHCVSTAQAKAIIFSSDYESAVNEVSDSFSHMKLYQYNTNPNVKVSENVSDIVEGLKSCSGEDLGAEMVRLEGKEKLLYVYTSGTTGLPKAAIITQMRYIMMAAAVNYMVGLKKDDIIYNPLPLYHSSGGGVGLGQVILFGRTMALRKKFSASNYWKDCIKYKCTAAQYIGELCRYLLSVPPGDSAEKNHSVRLVYGNGLKIQIWNSFVERFGIQDVIEFYGATEGNSNFVNFDGTPGAVGFKPRWVGLLYPVLLIRYDEVTGEPLRDINGLCIPCKPNEPGILIGKINKKKVVNDFTGYTDPKATKKKILQSVLEKNDFYFNSGDILIMDELGYFYFKDRTGDTFRWKGENVATNEVEAIISNIIKLQDSVVYGVQIPHTDGRCGMAAIVDPSNVLNLQELAKGLRKNLPSYACPLFLRVMKEVPLTGTYKLKKVDLQVDGYDINKVKDKLYFYNSKLSEYVPLTPELYQDIVDGKVRV